MPEFENLDRYEATDPKTGTKRVVPIAPHSMQASNYRPRKRDAYRNAPEDKLPPLKKAQFEVVSVEQMEKEFRQAGKRQSKRERSPRNPIQDLIAWIRSLFAPKKRKAVSSKGTRARDRNDKRSGSKNGSDGKGRSGSPSRDNRAGSGRYNNSNSSSSSDSSSGKSGNSKRKRRRNRDDKGDSGGQPKRADNSSAKQDFKQDNRQSNSPSGDQANSNKRRRKRRRRPSGGGDGNSSANNANPSQGNPSSGPTSGGNP